MFAVMYVVTFALLLTATLWIGALVYRATTRRSLQLLASVLVFAAPFWDVIPGLYHYSRAVRDLAGVRIHEVATAEGYLDLTSTDCSSCPSVLQEGPYQYVEIKRTTGWGMLGALDAQPGYYEYRRVQSGSEECAPFEALPNAAQLRQQLALDDRCVVVRRRDQPISRYQYETSSGWQPLENYGWPRPVYAWWWRVVDTHTRRMIAEAYSIRYVAWFWPLRIAPWTRKFDEPGSHSVFDVEQIIKPVAHRQEATPWTRHSR